MIEKILVYRYVKFDESFRWNWENCKVKVQEKKKTTWNRQPPGTIFKIEEEDLDDDDAKFPIRSTKTFVKIYEICNFVALEPKEYDEVAEIDGWKFTM